MQQLLAHQLAAQQLGTQQPSAMNAFPGLSNGAAQSVVGAWTQQQPNTEQINPALTPRHQLLQQLAQYHYLVAQQLAQLAAATSSSRFYHSLRRPIHTGRRSIYSGPVGRELRARYHDALTGRQ